MAIPSFQVLIVDDNEINRDMLARRLRRPDFNLSMAVNGREALSMIQSNLYDLILLDIMMPEIDGYTVLKHLKADPRLTDIPVIMISALEEMDSVMKCMEIGAEDYLTKPFDSELLKAAINRCLSNKIPSDPVTSPSLINVSSLDSSSIDTKIQTAEFKEPENTTHGTPTNLLTVEEVVLRIMKTGMINRKAYLYFSKAIFNTLFENSGLSEQELHQIRSVFDAIQSGQVRVIDSQSPRTP